MLPWLCQLKMLNKQAVIHWVSKILLSQGKNSSHASQWEELSYTGKCRDKFKAGFLIFSLNLQKLCEKNYRRRFAPTVILPEVPKINNSARIIIGSYAGMTVWINCSSDLKNFANSRPSASNFKSFSRSLEKFFLTAVGQNNFGNKIPFLNIIDLSSTSTKWIHKLIYLCGCSTILWIGMTTQSAGLFTIRTWKNWRLWFHYKPQTRNSGIEITVIPGNNFFKD